MIPKRDPLAWERDLARASGVFLLHLEPLRGISHPVVAVSACRGAVLWRGSEDSVREAIEKRKATIVAELYGPVQAADPALDDHDPGPIVTDHAVSYREQMIASDRGVILLKYPGNRSLNGHARPAVAISYRTGAVIINGNELYVRDLVARMGARIVAEYPGADRHQSLSHPESQPSSSFGA